MLGRVETKKCVILEKRKPENAKSVEGCLKRWRA